MSYLNYSQDLGNSSFAPNSNMERNTAFSQNVPYSDRFSTKSDYGRILETQARDRMTQQKKNRQEEIEQEKKLLEMNYDPFGKDRIKYTNAQSQSTLNAQKGFVGIGNQIVNQKNIFQPQSQVSVTNINQTPAPQPNYNYNDEYNQQRKRDQQDELKRVYQQQIAEKEQRRVFDLQKKMMEDAEERRKYNQELEFKWQNEETNRKLVQELLAQQLMMQDALKNRQSRKTPRYEVEVPVELPTPVFVEEKVREETPKVEEEEEPPVDNKQKIEELKSEVYGVMTEQIKNVLGFEMKKLKNHLDLQNHVLKDQIQTLRGQALFAEELRQDAVLELHTLQKDMKTFKVFEDIRNNNLSHYLKDVAYLYKNTQPISDNGNFDFSFPERRLRPLYPREVRKDVDKELTSSINFLPIREPIISSPYQKEKKQKAASSDFSQIKPNRIAMNRYNIIPDYIDLNQNNPYLKEAKSDQLWKGKEFDKFERIDDDDILNRNEKRLETLDQLYREDEVGKLEYLLRDSLFRGQN